MAIPRCNISPRLLSLTIAATNGCKLPTTFPVGTKPVSPCQAGKYLASGYACTLACAAGYQCSGNCNVATQAKYVCWNGNFVSTPTIQCAKIQCMRLNVSERQV